MGKKGGYMKGVEQRDIKCSKCGTVVTVGKYKSQVNYVCGKCKVNK